MEHFTETVVEGVAMKAARRSQFGGRVDDAGHDHGDDQIALSAGRGVEDGIQVQVAQATENCGLGRHGRPRSQLVVFVQQS